PLGACLLPIRSELLRFLPLVRLRLLPAFLGRCWWWTFRPRWRLWWAIRLGGSRFRTVARRRLSRPILRLRCWWTIIPRWRLWRTIRLRRRYLGPVVRCRWSRAIFWLRGWGSIISCRRLRRSVGRRGSRFRSIARVRCISRFWASRRIRSGPAVRRLIDRLAWSRRLSWRCLLHRRSRRGTQFLHLGTIYRLAGMRLQNLLPCRERRRWRWRCRFCNHSSV